MENGEKRGIKEMKNKKFKSRYLAFVMAVVFVFSQTATVFAVQTDFDFMLSQLRQELFSPARGARDAGLRQVFVDMSGIPHTPPMDIEHLLEEGIQPASEFIPQVYGFGLDEISRRQFNVRRPTPTSGHWGELLAQGARVNIWFLDGVDRPTQAQLDGAIARFDDITFRMTRDFAPFGGVVAQSPWSNGFPAGDIHGDGRINVLFHEGWGGGYFSAANYVATDENVPIAVFQMSPDLIEGPHSGPTFAHELQHLLFHLYFGIYASSPELVWFNEMLSMLAMTYYAVDGEEIVPIGIGGIIDASENAYFNFGEHVTGVGDFVNFNNSNKNYSMSNMYAIKMHRLTDGQFATGVYSFLRTEFPPAQNSTEALANVMNITSSTPVELVGNILNRVGISGGNYGQLAFELLYFIFMEAFASDGGTIEGILLRPFIDSSFSANRFWGIRPSMGLASGFDLFGSMDFHVFYEAGVPNSLSDRVAVPTLLSGGTANLTGYNGTPSLGATHEMLYRLAGENVETPILTISVDDNDPMTQWYIAVPNDPVGSISNSANRTLGSQGARVYPLLRGGVENEINTSGQTAYLFVATLFRNVENVTVTYSWGSEFDDPSLSGDDPTSTGDDPTSSTGDDPSSSTGDDPTSTGDDPSSTGDDPSSSTGDDPSSTGDDPTSSTGDDPTSSAGDDPTTQEPQVPAPTTPRPTTAPRPRPPAGGGGGGGGGVIIPQTPRATTAAPTTAPPTTVPPTTAPPTTVAPTTVPPTTNSLILYLDRPIIENTATNTILTMDVAPTILDGRTLVPIRFVAEALGATVLWQESTQTVTIILNNETITFRIGELAPNMDVPAIIIGNRAMVPLRFVAETFGYQVNWDPDTARIEIILH